MLPNLFTHPVALVGGLLAGIVLGFLLQKSNLTHFKTIVGQFLLQDFTMLKVMLTAIFVGSLGIYATLGLGLPISLHLKSATILAIVLGATIMGVGIVFLGSCPGICLAAAGQGTKEAWWGLLGMLIGAAVYSEIYALLKNNILDSVKIPTLRLPELLNVSPWLLIAILGVIIISIRLFSNRTKA
jgi:uncharacterized protein